jgi:hypothetical protein
MTESGQSRGCISEPPWEPSNGSQIFLIIGFIIHSMCMCNYAQGPHRDGGQRSQ